MNPRTPLTELQFAILNGMADDYEDAEQLYLSANRDLSEEQRKGVVFPRKVLGEHFPLHDLMDELRNMVRLGYIEAKYSNDEQVAPLSPLDFTALHHYWFGSTVQGKELWRAYREKAQSE